MSDATKTTESNIEESIITTNENNGNEQNNSSENRTDYKEAIHQQAKDIRSSTDFGRNDALIVYICFGLSFFLGITWFAALIYAYVRRDDIKDTIYYSHLNYMIRTCWWGLLWAVIGSILLFVFVGIFVLIGAGIWAIYRLIRGFIAFNDYRPMV